MLCVMSATKLFFSLLEIVYILINQKKIPPILDF